MNLPQAWLIFSLEHAYGWNFRLSILWLATELHVVKQRLLFVFLIKYRDRGRGNVGDASFISVFQAAVRRVGNGSIVFHAWHSPRHFHDQLACVKRGESPKCNFCAVMLR